MLDNLLEEANCGAAVTVEKATVLRYKHQDKSKGKID